MRDNRCLTTCAGSSQGSVRTASSWRSRRGLVSTRSARRPVVAHRTTDTIALGSHSSRPHPSFRAGASQLPHPGAVLPNDASEEPRGVRSAPIAGVRCVTTRSGRGVGPRGHRSSLTGRRSADGRRSRLIATVSHRGPRPFGSEPGDPDPIVTEPPATRVSERDDGKCHSFMRPTLIPAGSCRGVGSRRGVLTARGGQFGDAAGIGSKKRRARGRPGAGPLYEPHRQRLLALRLGLSRGNIVGRTVLPARGACGLDRPSARTIPRLVQLVAWTCSAAPVTVAAVATGARHERHDGDGHVQVHLEVDLASVLQQPSRRGLRPGDAVDAEAHGCLELLDSALGPRPNSPSTSSGPSRPSPASVRCANCTERPRSPRSSFGPHVYCL